MPRSAVFARLAAGLGLAVLAAAAVPAGAETRLALKSARQASTYYAFAVGMSNAVMAGAPDITVTVETSPGSMVNVKDALKRDDYLFTTPPNLIKEALAGKGKFTEKGYDQVRGLWPVPALVMHWVVTEESGVKDLRGLAGKMFIPGGVGSAGADITNQVFTALGIKDKVDLASVDLNEGVQAVKNRRAVGFSTASTPPAAMVTELASTTPVRVLELNDADYAKVNQEDLARYTLPAGLYRGQDQEVKTVGVAVGLYTKAGLPAEVAYRITKAFWENRPVWEKSHPSLKLLKMEEVNLLAAKLHPGALKYYDEIGFKVAGGLR